MDQMSNFSADVKLALLVADDKTINEIATALEISYTAAKKRRTRLKQRLEKEGLDAHEYVKRLSKDAQTPEEAVSNDMANVLAQRAKVTVDAKYKAALSRIETLQKERDALMTIKAAKTNIRAIAPPKGSHTEATAVIVASDWHIEEQVFGNTVNFMNEFNPQIAKDRVDAFARNSVRLIQMFAKDITIRNLIIGLLGDFISGHIHDELKEICAFAPVEAAIFAKDQLVSAIHYIWENTELEKIIVVCKVGNHGRITDRPNHTTELGNSLEFFIYDAILSHFSQEQYGGQIEVQIDNSYHSYVKVYDYTIRFHHGHNLKYQGGVGGLYIPVHKAIDQWNRGIKADLDVFGHWHQYIPSEKFVCNGSLIGFNPYAISIKAGFEPPRQAFFMIDSKNRKIINTPIFLE